MEPLSIALALAGAFVGVFFVRAVDGFAQLVTAWGYYSAMAIPGPPRGDWFTGWP